MRCGQSELVGIISSQIEVEQDQRHGDEEEVDNRQDDLVHRSSDLEEEEWTRGPIQLRYDDNDQVSTDGHETISGLPPPLDEDQQDETKKGAGKSPLRLRGGVGLSRTKSGPLHSSQSTRGRETRDIDDSATLADQETIHLPNQSAGIKRSGSLGSLDKRRVLGVPGALRRFSSMPGGRFKPPRPTVAALNALPIGNTGGCKASDGVVASNDCSERKRNSDGADSSFGCGSDTESDKLSTRERSQVVVPGWGSQGHHPVEYRESQLNFVTTAELRSSPTLARRSEGSRGNGDGIFTGKKRKISEAWDVGRGASRGEESEERSPNSRTNIAVDGTKEIAGEEKERLGVENDSPGKESEVNQVDGGREAREAYPDVEMVTGNDSMQKLVGQRGREGDGIVETTADVERRWRGADERLYLAQRRGVSTLWSRGGDNNDGGKDEPVALASELSKVLPSSAVNARDRGGAGDRGECQIASAMNQDGSDTLARLDATPSEVLSQGSRKRNCAETRLEGDGNCSQGVDTNPPGVPGNNLPLSNPLSAMASSDNLSPCSDHSCMPPLGQRTPTIWMKKSKARCGTPASLQENDQQQWDMMEDDHSSHSPRFYGGGSPNQQRLSGFTPSNPRSCEYNSGVVILRPREKAPDPTMCAKALTDLGIPQVGVWTARFPLGA